MKVSGLKQALLEASPPSVHVMEGVFLDALSRASERGSRGRRHFVRVAGPTRSARCKKLARSRASERFPVLPIAGFEFGNGHVVVFAKTNLGKAKVHEIAVEA